MSPSSAIVIVCDLVPASLLAPWGCTWLETPCTSRLASESLLIETHWASSASLATLYDSYWTGKHPLEKMAVANPSLIERLAQKKIEQTLITDEPQLVALPAAQHFSEVIHLPPVEEAVPSEAVDATGMWQLAQLAIEHLTTKSAARQGSLTWIHLQGLLAPWDAPTEWRTELADEDDPEPPTTTTPPVALVTEATDPDLLLGWQQAAAAQVRVLDQVLGELMTAIDTLEGDPLVIFTSPRGYPLGFHGRIGPTGASLYSDLLHTPLLVRFPRDATGNRPGKLYREQNLTQPEQLYQLLLEHVAFEDREPTSTLYAMAHDLDFMPQERAVTAERDERLLRTRAWQLLVRKVAGDEQFELFAKADDRWEVNEVARRLPTVVQQLAAELASFEAAAEQQALTTLPKLPEVLADQRH